MAARNAFFSRLESPTTVTAGTSSDILTIDGASLAATNDYLLLAYARGTHVTANISDCVSIRNEGVAISDSTGTIGNGSTEASPYWFMIEVTTDASPSDITMRIDAPAAADDTTIDVAWVLLLDATQLTSTNYQYAEDLNNEALSTSTVAGASITFTPGQEEDWLVISAAEFLGAFGSTQTSHWIDLDSATDTTPLVVGTGASASGNYSSLIARVYTLDASSHTLLNQFVHSSATFQSAKRWDTIVAIRLDGFDDAAHTYTAAEAAMSTSLAQVQTVSFTPAAAGDYFVLGSFNADGVTVNDDLYARVQANGADVLPGDDGTTTKIRNVTDADEEAVITLGGAVTLQDVANTIDMDASVETAGNAEERELVVFGPLTDLGLPAGLSVTRTDMVESQVRVGGEDIVLTLSNDTWKSAVGDCSWETDVLIGGMVSAQAEDLGWNAVVTGRQYAYEVLSDSPALYWPMDETSGTSVADAAGSITGTAASGVAVGTDGLLQSSKRTAYRFGDPSVTAANSKITGSDAAAIQDVFSGGGTVEMVVQAAGVGTSGATSEVACSKGSWNVWFYDLVDGRVRVAFEYLFSGTNGRWVTDALLPLGVTSHVAITFNSSSASNTPSIYINGSKMDITVVSTPTGTATTDVGSDLIVGNLSPAAVPFRGKMSDFALYTAAKAQSIIVDHAKAASAPTTLTCDDVTQDSGSQVTIALPPFPVYDITATETITTTALGEVLTGGSDLTSDDTFDIDPDGTNSGYSVPPGAGSVPQDNDPGPPLPFGSYNGGLGADVIGATRQLGAGDTWQIGLPTMGPGLGTGSRPKFLRIEAVEIIEAVDDD